MKQVLLIMNAKKLQEQLTESFCSKDEWFRKELMTPVEVNDGISFSNEAMAIIISKELMPIECNLKKDISLLEDDNLSIEITSDELQSVIDRIPKIFAYQDVEEKCPECEGEGTVTAEYWANHKNEDGEHYFEFDVDCPICEGTGTIIVSKITDERVINKNAVITFNGFNRYYTADKLLKLQEAMKIFDVDKSKIVHIGEKFIVNIKQGVSFIGMEYIPDANDKITTISL